MMNRDQCEIFKKKLLDYWLSIYKSNVNEKQFNQMSGNLNGKNEDQFKHAFFELFLFVWFHNQGYEIDVEPDVANSNNKPDFFMKDPETGFQFYLEATTETGGDRNQRYEKALKDAAIKNGFSMSGTVNVTEALRRKTTTKDPQNFNAGLRLMETLDRKAKHYGDFGGIPYVIAVNLDSYLYTVWSTSPDMLASNLYGTDYRKRCFLNGNLFLVETGKHDDGFWSQGKRENVSGVLCFFCLNPFSFLPDARNMLNGCHLPIMGFAPNLDETIRSQLLPFFKVSTQDDFILTCESDFLKNSIPFM